MELFNLIIKKENKNVSMSLRKKKLKQFFNAKKSISN
jgi:hypothetical protein